MYGDPEAVFASMEWWLLQLTVNILKKWLLTANSYLEINCHNYFKKSLKFI